MVSTSYTYLISFIHSFLSLSLSQYSTLYEISTYVYAIVRLIFQRPETPFARGKNAASTLLTKSLSTRRERLHSLLRVNVVMTANNQASCAIGVYIAFNMTNYSISIFTIHVYFFVELNRFRWSD